MNHGTCPFGKYKGQSWADVPLRALEHYLGWDQLRPETRSIIEAEISRRNGEPGTPQRTPSVRGLQKRIAGVMEELKAIAQALGEMQASEPAPALDAWGEAK
ncbi:MAG: hypothetical protein AB7T14_04015 [Candidatus Methylacidiphilaceae bacterium]